MEKLRFAPPFNNSLEGQMDFMVYALREIERASALENVGDVVEAYFVSNFTTSRSLDSSTATVTDVANFFCTFIDDLKKQRI